MAVGVAILAVSFFGVICSPIVPYAKLHDFLSFYTGAWIVSQGQTAQLYSVEHQEQTQQTLSRGAVPVLAPYIRPPHYAFFLQPLAWLPLDHAFVVWLTINIALALAAWYWAFRRFGPDALIYCAFFIPVGYGILNGQDCVFILWLMLGAWLAAEKGRDTLAGALAGATLFKFHLLTLVPVIILARKRWRMMAGYTAMGAVQVAISLWMVGVEGMRSYFEILTHPELAALNPSVEMMINIGALLANLGADWVALRIIAPLAVVAGLLLMERQAAMDRWFWGAATASLLITPHTYEYDAAILLVPSLLLLMKSESKPQRVIAALMVAPVPFMLTVFKSPWAIAPSLVTILFFMALTHPWLLDGAWAARLRAHRNFRAEQL